VKGYNAFIKIMGFRVVGKDKAVFQRLGQKLPQSLKTANIPAVNRDTDLSIGRR
jgi:hypothetical protein